MYNFGFDGVDIDWEYPGVLSRGGSAADAANFVALLSDMRTAFGSTFGISVALPITASYLQYYDIAGMEPYVDWFNVMSYGLHGPWDATNGQGAYVKPTTNLTEIDQKLAMGFWRLKIPMSKLNLGLAYYGRSYTLADPTCTAPGCAWSDVGAQGACSLNPGVLMNAEIRNIIGNYSIKPTLDKAAAINYFTYSGNQWVSYDTRATFVLKQSYANSHCFGGTFIWDLSQANGQASANPQLQLMVLGTGAYY